MDKVGTAISITRLRRRRPTLAELRQLYPNAANLTAPNRCRPSLADLRRKLDMRREAARAIAEAENGDSNHSVEGAALLRSEEVGLSTAPKEYRSTPLQKATSEWLSEVEWNLMITLTFDSERGVSLPLASKLFGKFIPRLRDVVLRKGSRRKIRLVAVVEDSNEQLRAAGASPKGREGTHIHLLLQVRGGDYYKFKEDIRKAWRATNRLCGEPRIYCPNSTQWYLPLTSDAMREGFTGYILKHHGTDTLGLLTQYLHLD